MPPDLDTIPDLPGDNGLVGVLDDDPFLGGLLYLEAHPPTLRPPELSEMNEAPWSTAQTIPASLLAGSLVFPGEPLSRNGTAASVRCYADDTSSAAAHTERSSVRCDAGCAHRGLWARWLEVGLQIASRATVLRTRCVDCVESRQLVFGRIEVET